MSLRGRLIIYNFVLRKREISADRNTIGGNSRIKWEESFAFRMSENPGSTNSDCYLRFFNFRVFHTIIDKTKGFMEYFLGWTKMQTMKLVLFDGFLCSGLLFIVTCYFINQEDVFIKYLASVQLLSGVQKVQIGAKYFTWWIIALLSDTHLLLFYFRNGILN